MPVHSSSYPFIHPQPVRPSIRPPTIHLPVRPPIHPSIDPLTHPSICPSVRPSVHSLTLPFMYHSFTCWAMAPGAFRGTLSARPGTGHTCPSPLELQPGVQRPTVFPSSIFSCLKQKQTREKNDCQLTKAPFPSPVVLATPCSWPRPSPHAAPHQALLLVWSERKRVSS